MLDDTPPSLTLVVPVYNEAARLDGEAVLAFLAADASVRVLFVDDGSTDDTPTVLDALTHRAPARISVQRLERNQGKAEAVRRGIVAALADGAALAGFADADLSAPLEEVFALRDELGRFPDAWAAFGSRVKLLGRHIERSELRHYLGRVFATFASLALGLPVYDTQCGLKLFRNLPEVQQAFATPFQSRWIFDVELLARLARTAGEAVPRRLREVPLERWEARGRSRLGIWDFVRAPMELWLIQRRYRPR